MYWHRFGHHDDLDISSASEYYIDAILVGAKFTYTDGEYALATAFDYTDHIDFTTLMSEYFEEAGTDDDFYRTVNPSAPLLTGETLYFYYTIEPNEALPVLHVSGSLVAA